MHSRTSRSESSLISAQHWCGVAISHRSLIGSNLLTRYRSLVVSTMRSDMKIRISSPIPLRPSSGHFISIKDSNVLGNSSYNMYIRHSHISSSSLFLLTRSLLSRSSPKRSGGSRRSIVSSRRSVLITTRCISSQYSCIVSSSGRDGVVPRKNENKMPLRTPWDASETGKKISRESEPNYRLFFLIPISSSRIVAAFS